MEHGALQTAAWYLADRVWKRRGARVLRGGAAGGVVAGAALPLLDMTGVVGGVAPWGYLALLLGVACVAVDRFFGVTSGWIRDVATAQAVQRRLQVLQFDWASESVREVLGPDGGYGLRGGRAVSGGAAALLRGRDGAGAGGDGGLDGGVPDGGGADGDPGGGDGGAAGGFGESQGRFPLPPGAGARPNMPRQRPPEPR